MYTFTLYNFDKQKHYCYSLVVIVCVLYINIYVVITSYMLFLL